MGNSTSEVSVGKPRLAGAVYTAPLGTTLPTSTDSTLSEAYVQLGYASDDGLTNSREISSEEIKAWGGDTVLTPQTDTTDRFQIKLIQCLNPDVLKAAYGSDNVSGTIDGTGITVRVNSAETEERVWIFDMIMTEGALKRIVIPKGKLTELGDIVYKDNEAVGYDMTISALPGGFGVGDNDTHKEYIKKIVGINV